MIEKIGIIGCGKMGTDIFNYLSSFSFQLVLIGKSRQSFENVEKAWLRKQKRALSLSLISNPELDQKISQVQFSTELCDLAGTDLVIESITEDQKLKSELFKTLDKILPDNVILTTNTSSIPLSELIPSTRRQPVMFGLHFFYPIAIKNLVEINFTPHIGLKTKHAISEFLDAINRFHIFFPEPNHFLVNRLFVKLQAGAFNICSHEKIPYEVVDGMIREKLFPAGVFHFFDQVGIDIMYAAVRNYTNQYPDAEFFKPLLADLKEKKDQNHLGIKTGKGYYNYSGQDRMAISDDIPDLVRKSLLHRLSGYFLEPMRQAIRQKLLTRSELEHIVAEYSGTDISPYDLAKEIGVEDF